MHDDTSLVGELEEAVKTFASRKLGASRARRAASLPGGFDRELWKVLAESGWVGILVPEEHGGTGLGLREMAAVARGLGGALLPEPLVACAVLAARTLALIDDDVRRDSLLRALCAGDLLATVAWQEHPKELDPDPRGVIANERDGDVVVSGTKRFVPFADAADGYVVSTRLRDAIALVWIERGATGVTLETERLADGSTQATIHLKDAPGCLLRASGEDDGGLADAIDAARIIAAAELLGVASTCLEVTLEYLRTRVQFGKPIGTFQALQHRAVNLYVQKELGTSALEVALAEYGARPYGVAQGALASRAKARCSEAALEIAREAIQMHGAIGWTDECDVGLHVKRALVLSAWLGNAAAHRRRYARLSPLERAHD